MDDKELAKHLASRIFEMGGNGRGLIRSELEDMLEKELMHSKKKKTDAAAKTVVPGYGVI